MKPLETLGRAASPDGTALTLTRRDTDYVIFADGESLMTSRLHYSEDVLGSLGCDEARSRPRAAVLIGGLGMGFTLRAALDVLRFDATVTVAELVPEVVTWNQTFLGGLAGHPLDDPRVRLELADVGALMRASRGRFDAILLDVDNGPAAMTTRSNASLYDEAGIAAARVALKPGGLLAVWAVKASPRFEKDLRKAGFDVRRQIVHNRPNRKAGRQCLMIGRLAAARQR